MSPVLIYLLSELISACYGLLLLGFWFTTATLLALVTQGFLQLFNFALDEGHILSFWYEFILRFERSSPKLFKVLGGCFVCSGFWVSLLLFYVYQRVLPPLPLPLPVLVIYQALVMYELVRLARKLQAKAALVAAAQQNGQK
jgi:hypothetical protein